MRFARVELVTTMEPIRVSLMNVFVVSRLMSEVSVDLLAGKQLPDSSGSLTSTKSFEIHQERGFRSAIAKVRGTHAEQ